MGRHRGKHEGRIDSREIEHLASVACCPECGRACARHSVYVRRLRDLGNGRPAELRLKGSKHHCRACGLYFIYNDGHLGQNKGSHYTRRVRELALKLHREGKSLQAVCEALRRDYHLRLPPTTLHEWVFKEMEGEGANGLYLARNEA
jgi:hypothetical protein